MTNLTGSNLGDGSAVGRQTEHLDDVSQPRDLPEGWVSTPLETIANWGSGGTPSRKHAAYYGGNVPWIKTGDLGDRVVTNASEFITDEAVKNSSAKWFPSGSVVLAMYGATIGKTSILGLDATTNQACAVGNPIDGVTFTEFLYYFLLNEKDVFIAKGKGGAQPNISQALIKAHEIALPPLAEQRVIADKLDELLAQVESTKARLDAIPAILKTFRQAVLAAAVSGKLTEEWRESNISKFPYTRRQLGKIIHEMRNGLSSKPNELGNGYPILRISSVRSFSLDQVDVRYLEVSKNDQERYALKPNDLLFTRYNGSIEFVGVCARVQKLEHDILLYPDKLIRIRVDSDQVTPEYLEIFSACQEARDYVHSLVKSTSGQKGISGADLKQMDIVLPAVTEQTEIVRRVEELFACADRVESQVNAAQSRVNNLTQAILAKAFRGELTAEWRAANPDLISGDNSAEALLKRIKAERALSGSKPKSTQGKRVKT